MSNVSDRNGRALETIVTSSFINEFEHIKLLGGTQADQERDSVKVDSLPPELLSRYKKSSVKIVGWFISFHCKEKPSSITIERLSDDVAKKGDPTDIRIIVNGNTINISLKHNHKAVKHQRPGALPQQCGFVKNSSEDSTYRNSYKQVCDTFINKADTLDPGATLFNELKAIDGSFIDIHIYKPICELVAKFINTNCNNAKQAAFMFNFLVGTTDYHKIIVNESNIEILDFINLSNVNNVRAEITSNSYIHLHFSNEWVLSMRLHTASSRLSGVSLKFDTQPHIINIPTLTINL